MRPARPIPAPVPMRVNTAARPNSETPTPEASGEMASAEPTQPRTMIVGRGISLSGDITSCNRLVVEGSLEATLHDCNQMEIADGVPTSVMKALGSCEALANGTLSIIISGSAHAATVA